MLMVIDGGGTAVEIDIGLFRNCTYVGACKFSVYAELPFTTGTPSLNTWNSPFARLLGVVAFADDRQATYILGTTWVQFQALIAPILFITGYLPVKKTVVFVYSIGLPCADVVCLLK